MGGDFAPEATTLGAIAAQREFPSDVRIVLIGDQEQITAILKREGVDANAFDLVHAPETIGMGEHPTRALTKKPDSSIAIGFNMLKNKEIDAFSSVGNTGAMLVGSMYSVKTIPGIIRPGITTILPKDTGEVGILLDVGTNADCKPDVLYQFAILGSSYANHVYKIKSPRVGLLNIGEEEEKGNLLTQATHALMKDTKAFNFIGNVEGRDLFNDKADVIVCDGFTGNIVLKEIEAFYTLIKKRGIKDEYFDRLNYELYGGTPILGINASVVIGHGISNATAIKNMLFLSRDVVTANLPQKIQKAFN
jgi:glycerol-3-phosphate acyltransferase PlsX